jgi:hypothetical protein
MSSGVAGKNEVPTVLTMSGKRTYSRIYRLPHIFAPLASQILEEVRMDQVDSKRFGGCYTTLRITGFFLGSV